MVEPLVIPFVVVVRDELALGRPGRACRGHGGGPGCVAGIRPRPWRIA